MISSNILPMIIILLILVLVFLIIAHKGKPRMNKKHFEKQWNHVEDNDNYHAAVLKADELLNDALKNAGIKGSTTGEKLNNAVGFLRDINATWAAHKVHNKIIEEPAEEITAIECQKALRQYKRALKDLGAL